MILLKYLYRKKAGLFLSIISILLSSVVLCSCFSDEADSSQSETTKPQDSDIDIESSYSYNNLPDKKTKELYMKIGVYALKDEAENFVIDGEYSETEMFESFEAYKNDHPDVFWLDSTYDYYYKEGQTNIKIPFIFENEKLEQAKEEFDEKVEEVLNNAPENASDYELELYFNDYIVDNCEYNKKAAKVNIRIANEGNAYGALIDKKAVCEGYSRAFQLLCNRANIDCVSILGETEDSPHQWNCVKLDDNWYHVDVTWNDTDEDNQWVKYDYFNLSDEQISKDHDIRDLYSEAEIDASAEYATIYNLFIPECTGTEYNYYRQSCVTLTDVDNSDEVVSAMAESAQKGEDYFSFVIDESLDYEQTAYTIINDGYMYSWVEDANAANDYSIELNPGCMVYQNESFNVLTIELEYL